MSLGYACNVPRSYGHARAHGIHGFKIPTKDPWNSAEYFYSLMFCFVTGSFLVSVEFFLRFVCSLDPIGLSIPNGGYILLKPRISYIYLIARVKTIANGRGCLEAVPFYRSWRQVPYSACHSCKPLRLEGTCRAAIGYPDLEKFFCCAFVFQEG